MTGTIQLGSPDVFTNILAQGRVGDLVVGFCGHVGTILPPGSPDTFANSLSVARKADRIGSNCLNGSIISGSIDTFING
jgi:uncharacterized Zn-binding protein involved in type VI secretion